MGLWNDPVDTIANRLKDTLVFSVTGNHVADYALDLLNRAQNWLSMYRNWDYMKKIAPLTVVDRIATLPLDTSVILDVYNTDGTGIPVNHYTKDAADLAERYELYDSFTPDAGHVWSIQFSGIAPITSQLYLKYIYNLPNIEAGQTYTFFPSELLFRCAQKLHHEDKGTTGDTAAEAIRAFNELLDSFIRLSQFTNQKMDLGVQNAYGTPVKIGGHNLTGTSAMRYRSPYQNSSLLTG